MSKALNMLKLVESIGKSNPLADDEGVLRYNPNEVHVYNKSLKNKMNEEYKKIAKNKPVTETVESIEEPEIEIENDDDDIAKSKVKDSVRKCIQSLDPKLLEYWCEDEATKTLAIKVRTILQKFEGYIK